MKPIGIVSIVLAVMLAGCGEIVEDRAKPPPGFTLYRAQDGYWNYRDSRGWMDDDAGYGTREGAIKYAWSWYDWNGGFKEQIKRVWSECE